MRDYASTIVAPIGLVTGTVFGMAGSFAASVPVRTLLWGVDGIALVVAAALLTAYHLRRGNDILAAGFLVYVSGQALVLASADGDLGAGGRLFAPGAALWAAALILISVPKVMPLWLRAVAVAAAVMFVIFAIQVFSGRPLTSLSRPLPFFAYPLLSATLLGWAWVHYRKMV